MAQETEKAPIPAAPKTQRKYSEVQTNFVTLGGDEGQVASIEGQLLSRDTVSFRKNGEIQEVGRYVIRDDEGTEWTVLGSTILDHKLMSVPDGADVMIQYNGQKRTGGGNRIKDFGVYVAE